MVEENGWLHFDISSNSDQCPLGDLPLKVVEPVIASIKPACIEIETYHFSFQGIIMIFRIRASDPGNLDSIRKVVENQVKSIPALDLKEKPYSGEAWRGVDEWALMKKTMQMGSELAIMARRTYSASKGMPPYRLQTKLIHLFVEPQLDGLDRELDLYIKAIDYVANCFQGFTTGPLKDAKKCYAIRKIATADCESESV